MQHKVQYGLISNKYHHFPADFTGLIFTGEKSFTGKKSFWGRGVVGR